MRQGLSDIAEEEARHARALDGLVGIVSLTPFLDPGAPTPDDDEPTDQLQAQSWSSAIMVAFALDQAATACLAALAHTKNRKLARLAQTILADERGHQQFILGVFKELADDNPAMGNRLAAEMLIARDWVRQVFPRRDELASLAEAGLLLPEGPKAHDTYLASLGDRIQDALGVLGC